MSSTNFNPNEPSIPIISAVNRLDVRFQAIEMGKPEIAAVGQLSPAFLAYLGDAVYELYVRTHYLLPPSRLTHYHKQVVAQVRAETQATHLKRLTPYLTDKEADMVRRGRNAATSCPRRLSPELYQQASSLETLIGYLYLHDSQRLNELFDILTEYSLEF